MNVTFYRNNSSHETVSKSLSTVKTVSCVLKENTSMLLPTILIGKDTLPSWNGVNYMYIDTFGRYYDILPETVQAVTGGMIEVGGKVDALSSNESAVRSLRTLVLRQENKYNLYYQDTELPIRAEKTFVYKKVGSLPNVRTNVLTVDGG